MKGLYLHVQCLELLAHQGTAMSQIKVTQRVRPQGWGFSLGSHLNHSTELPSFMDKQSRVSHTGTWYNPNSTNQHFTCMVSVDNSCSMKWSNSSFPIIPASTQLNKSLLSRAAAAKSCIAYHHHHHAFEMQAVVFLGFFSRCFASYGPKPDLTFNMFD